MLGAAKRKPPIALGSVLQDWPQINRFTERLAPQGAQVPKEITMNVDLS